MTSPIDDRDPAEVALLALREPAYRRDAAATSPDVVLEALLGLEAERELDAADELRTAYAAHLEETGGAASMTDEQRSLWSQVNALSSRELSLPSMLRADLAGSLLTRLVDGAVPAARAVRLRSVAEAERVAEALRRHAPSLGAPVLSALASDPPKRPLDLTPLFERVKRTMGLLGAGAVAVFVAGQIQLPWRKPLPEHARADVASDDLAGLRGASAAPNAARASADRRRGVADASARVRDALDEGSCARVKDAATRLRSHFLSLAEEERAAARRDLSVLDEAADACP